MHAKKLPIVGVLNACYIAAIHRLVNTALAVHELLQLIPIEIVCPCCSGKEQKESDTDGSHMCPLSINTPNAPGERRPTGTEPRIRTEPALWAVRSTGLFGPGVVRAVDSALPFAMPCRRFHDNIPPPCA